MVANPCLSGGALELFLEPHLPPARVAVAGESPVARALVELAEPLGLPRAARARSPSRATSPPSSRRSGTATRTRCGAGSRRGASTSGWWRRARRGAAVLDALRAEGVADDALARVRTPAGLDIGARTHAEIALSILAELVQARRRAGRAGGRGRCAPRPREAVDPVCGMTVRGRARHADRGRRGVLLRGLPGAWLARAG